MGPGSSVRGGFSGAVAADMASPASAPPRASLVQPFRERVRRMPDLDHRTVTPAERSVNGRLAVGPCLAADAAVTEVGAPTSSHAAKGVLANSAAAAPVHGHEQSHRLGSLSIPE